MADVVTLADVRAHLRYPASDTSDDTALQGFIGAATEVINRECGDVIGQQYDEFYDGGGPTITTRNIPVLSVEMVEEGWGTQTYELQLQQVNTIPATNMFAYSLDDPANGVISRRSAGNVVIPFVVGKANIHVIYTTGLRAVPATVRLAALELIAHWWQNSQQVRSMGGAQDTYDAVNPDYTRTIGITLINQGIPYRILEMLKPYRRAPIIG